MYYSWTIFLPLISFAVIVSLIASLGSRLRDRNWMISTISCTLMGFATIISYIIFAEVFTSGEPLTVNLMTWINIDTLSVEWALHFDTLSCLMMAIIMTISTLVHLYAIEYMADDPGFAKFMAYLGLFTFMMLMLVTADNMVQLFFGWEGVGLASYLLIGFWYHKHQANTAALKAFIVNRVGDLGLVTAMGGLYYVFNSLSFSVIFSKLQSHHDVLFSVGPYAVPGLEVIGILVLIGAMGKSAQIGLHVWLPDAMEGPTPVSALIHAATMVTAGVFLIAKLSPLYEHTIYAKQIIIIIGTLTILFAASIALTQNDIKKVIAYSTCSQLGYMFVALGLGAYNLALFHLLTHAFFKALLFLGAGSVIHALSGEQDMRKMGGIYKIIPYTYVAMWIGTLGLTGFPFLAGYYSKDAIIEAAAHTDSWIGSWAYGATLIGALLTAMYGARLMFMTFHGTSHLNEKVKSYIHESGFFILLVLGILSVATLGVGYIGYKIIQDPDFWRQSLVLTSIITHNTGPGIVDLMTPAICIIGLVLTTLCYQRFGQITTLIKLRCARIYKLTHNKFYIDELYEAVIVKPLLNFGHNLWVSVDQNIIDRCGPVGISHLINRAARTLSRLQSGYIHHYALVFIIGFFGVLIWLNCWSVIRHDN